MLRESVYNGLANLATRFPPNSSVSAAIAHTSKAIEQIFPGSKPHLPPQNTANTLQDHLYEYLTNLADFFAGRSALENTSVLLALCTFCVFAMSWSTRFNHLGRFSPFTRSPPQGSTRVSDADFSYITADDLRKHNDADGSQHHHHSHRSTDAPPIDYGPPRDTDVLVFKNKKVEYAVHFPAYSIAKGELSIGQVRDHAAKKVGAADARRVKLLFRGKNLKDDGRTCRAEGLREGDQLMLTISDTQPSASDSEDDDDEAESGYLDGTDSQQLGADGEARRRRNRGKKSKRKARRDQTSGTSTPSEQQGSNLGVPSHHSQTSTRAPSPSKAPTTPLGKIDALRSKLDEFTPAVNAFLTSPPADPSKKDFEHKRISETILAQVLLKLDAVETEGDPQARQSRKDLVRETQAILSELDAQMKPSQL
ncbi:hypothetical protein LTR08_003505 [Meristemomyces frigidus]|nr:hypothetical protein LTR08_003505 [Meristemomyces frigidus]